MEMEGFTDASRINMKPYLMDQIQRRAVSGDEPGDLLDFRQLGPGWAELFQRSFDVFKDIQEQSDSTSEIADADKEMRLLAYSSRYLLVIRDICQAVSDQLQDPEIQANKKAQLHHELNSFRYLDHLWMLSEIVFLEHLKDPPNTGSNYILKLLNFRDTLGLPLVHMPERSANVRGDAATWQVAMRFVLLGQFEAAINWLDNLSSASRERPSVKYLRALLEDTPLFDQRPDNERITEWRHCIVELLMDGDVDRYEPVDRILQLMLGNFEDWATVGHEFTSWLSFYISRLLHLGKFESPLELGKDLRLFSEALGACKKQAFPPEMNLIFERILMLDWDEVFECLRKFFGNTWFNLHIWDILYHSGSLVSVGMIDQENFGKIREGLLVEYVRHAVDSNQWIPFVRYLKFCSTDVERILKTLLIQNRFESVDQKAQVIAALEEESLRFGIKEIYRLDATDFEKGKDYESALQVAAAVEPEFVIAVSDRYLDYIRKMRGSLDLSDGDKPILRLLPPSVLERLGVPGFVILRDRALSEIDREKALAYSTLLIKRTFVRQDLYLTVEKTNEIIRDIRANGDDFSVDLYRQLRQWLMNLRLSNLRPTSESEKKTIFILEEEVMASHVWGDHIHAVNHPDLHVARYVEHPNEDVPKPDFYISAAKAPYAPYNELRDPYLESYYARPEIRRILLQHGIIHPKNYKAVFGPDLAGRTGSTQGMLRKINELLSTEMHPAPPERQLLPYLPLAMRRLVRAGAKMTDRKISTAKSELISKPLDFILIRLEEQLRAVKHAVYVANQPTVTKNMEGYGFTSFFYKSLVPNKKADAIKAAVLEREKKAMRPFEKRGSAPQNDYPSQPVGTPATTKGPQECQIPVASAGTQTTLKSKQIGQSRDDLGTQTPGTFEVIPKDHAGKTLKAYRKKASEVEDEGDSSDRPAAAEIKYTQKYYDAKAYRERQDALRLAREQPPPRPNPSYRRRKPWKRAEKDPADVHVIKMWQPKPKPEPSPKLQRRRKAQRSERSAKNPAVATGDAGSSDTAEASSSPDTVDESEKQYQSEKSAAEQLAQLEQEKVQREKLENSQRQQIDQEKGQRDLPANESAEKQENERLENENHEKRQKEQLEKENTEKQQKEQLQKEKFEKDQLQQQEALKLDEERKAESALLSTAKGRDTSLLEAWREEHREDSFEVITGDSTVEPGDDEASREKRNTTADRELPDSDFREQLAVDFLVPGENSTERPLPANPMAENLLRAIPTYDVRRQLTQAEVEEHSSLSYDPKHFESSFHPSELPDRSSKVASETKELAAIAYETHDFKQTIGPEMKGAASNGSPPKTDDIAKQNASDGTGAAQLNKSDKPKTMVQNSTVTEQRQQPETLVRDATAEDEPKQQEIIGERSKTRVERKELGESASQQDSAATKAPAKTISRTQGSPNKKPLREEVSTLMQDSSKQEDPKPTETRILDSKIPKDSGKAATSETGDKTLPGSAQPETSVLDTSNTDDPNTMEEFTESGPLLQESSALIGPILEAVGEDSRLQEDETMAADPTHQKAEQRESSPPVLETKNQQQKEPEAVLQVTETQQPKKPASADPVVTSNIPPEMYPLPQKPSGTWPWNELVREQEALRKAQEFSNQMDAPNILPGQHEDGTWDLLTKSSFVDIVVPIEGKDSDLSATGSGKRNGEDTMLSEPKRNAPFSEPETMSRERTIVPEEMYPLPKQPSGTWPWNELVKEQVSLREKQFFSRPAKLDRTANDTIEQPDNRETSEDVNREQLEISQHTDDVHKESRSLARFSIAMPTDVAEIPEILDVEPATTGIGSRVNRRSPDLAKIQRTHDKWSNSNAQSLSNPTRIDQSIAEDPTDRHGTDGHPATLSHVLDPPTTTGLTESEHQTSGSLRFYHHERSFVSDLIFSDLTAVRDLPAPDEPGVDRPMK